ncbi:GATA zinc finger domain-containing protein 7 [Apiospora arundinis]|uniref:GATA zinc finger domain-containing protein 7 n=1 Tax=Apiospora arundinis TaxID=335852 RepID=A0ABR2I275_9PEZI
MAPCSDLSSGWAIASPSRNLDPSAGRSSPLDFNPDIKSADAAIQRLSRANNGGGGGTTYTREDIFDCFERIHRATEHLVDGVENERDQLDVRSEPDLCHRTVEQAQGDSDLVAMINVSQDILRTLRYVQANNGSSRQPQQQQERTSHQRRHSRHDRRDKEPVSPRQSIARGQKRKQEQLQEEQSGVIHKKKTHRTQPTYCRHCSCTDTVKWRPGPDGLKTLCNVCGLLYAKRLRRYHEMF